MGTEDAKPEYGLSRMSCPGSIEKRPALQIRRRNPGGFYSEFVCCLGLVRQGPGRATQYNVARTIILALDKAVKG